MLSFAELWEKLVSGDESVLLEAKRSEKVGQSTLETISAFSNEPNRGGGYLLLGVSVPRIWTCLEQIRGLPTAWSVYLSLINCRRNLPRSAVISSVQR